MNKYLILIFAAVALMFSCTGGKTGQGSEADSTLQDTLPADTAAVDTMEQLIEETPMPSAADELFDDFFFNFAANRRLQRERIKFPLPIFGLSDTTYVEEGKWQTDRFFMRQGYYTLIFGSRREMDVVKDTAVSRVTVEKIRLGRKAVRQYSFARERGRWMMESIHDTPLSANANASFLSFYRQFATDSAYQIAHINETVKFIGDDPDDEFSKMEGILTPDTWPAFAPELPSNTIYNIIYGTPQPSTGRKIFVLRGIANGLEVEITFRWKGGKWVLTELNQ